MYALVHVLPVKVIYYHRSWDGMATGWNRRGDIVMGMEMSWIDDRYCRGKGGRGRGCI